jgi:hypothetical protein
VAVEEVNFLAQGRANIRMLGQVPVERGGATTLRADDHEIWKLPQLGGLDAPGLALDRAGAGATRPGDLLVRDHTVADLMIMDVA